MFEKSIDIDINSMNNWSRLCGMGAKIKLYEVLYRYFYIVLQLHKQ